MSCSCERSLDEDLSAALEHNAVELDGTVTRILSTIEGANDGADWHWLVELSSGKFAYITGGCDYTGWDCQSNCEGFEADTVRDALRLVPEAYHDDIVMGMNRSVPT